MKAIIILGVAIAYFTASYAAPALETDAINWAAVTTKLTDIESVITVGASNVVSIAKGDNPTIGQTIEFKVNAAGADSYQHIELVRAKIRDASLTESYAREVLGRLKNILISLQADLQADIAKLSSGAAIRIRAALDDTYNSSESKAQELYILLRA